MRGNIRKTFSMTLLLMLLLLLLFPTTTTTTTNIITVIIIFFLHVKKAYTFGLYSLSKKRAISGNFASIKL